MAKRKTTKKRPAKVTPKKSKGRAAKKRTGRPPAKINLEQLSALREIGCTWDEICLVLGVSRSTFAARMRTEPFRTAYEKGRAEFKVSIRRSQKAQADKGNPTMLIWLGKQELDQRDVQYMTVGDMQQLLAEAKVRMNQEGERLAASHPESAELIQKLARVMAGAIAGDE